MEKYNVRIYLHSFVDVEVEADNEQEALEEAENKEYDMNQLLDNLVPDDEPTIERIPPIIEMKTELEQYGWEWNVLDLMPEWEIESRYYEMKREMHDI